MIVTTTQTIEGKRIVEYRGIVFGEVVAGVDFVKDFTAGLTNFFGGRSGSYEDELVRARLTALQELQERAADCGANAVVGVDVDYEVLGANNGMLMVSASGTAVVVEWAAAGKQIDIPPAIRYNRPASGLDSRVGRAKGLPMRKVRAP